MPFTPLQLDNTNGQTNTNTTPGFVPFNAQTKTFDTPTGIANAGTPAQTQEQPQPTFGGQLLRGIIRPFVRAINTPIEGIKLLAGQTPEQAAGTSKYLGDISGFGMKQGQTPLQRAKDVVGGAADIASNFIGLGAVGDVAKTVGEGALKAGLKEGAITGAKVGALGSFGNSLENDNGVGKTLLNTGIGAVGGAALGAAGEGVAAGVSKGAQFLKNTAVVDRFLPQTDARIASKEAAVQDAYKNIADQYEKVLPLTPTQKSKEASLLEKKGDNIYTTLAKNHINLGSEDASKQLQQVSDQFENATQHAQANEYGYFNVDKIKADAFDAVNKNIPSETARLQAKNKIETEIDALLKANPKGVTEGQNGEKMINSDLVERLRRTGNSWTNFNASDPEKIGMSTGYALSNAVRDRVEADGTFPAYREANRQWGNVIHAQEVLNKIDASGKTFKIPGGLSGSISRRILSGALGFHTAGIGGAILGEMGSEYGAKILANPELRTYFDRQIIENFGNKKPTPEAVAALEKQVKDFIDKQSTLKQLPAPASIPLGAEKPRPSSVELVPAQKNPTSMNPQTGKFQRSYSSSPTQMLK